MRQDERAHRQEQQGYTLSRSPYPKTQNAKPLTPRSKPIQTHDHKDPNSACRGSARRCGCRVACGSRAVAPASSLSLRAQQLVPTPEFRSGLLQAISGFVRISGFLVAGARG